jgi:hypothetical protein
MTYCRYTPDSILKATNAVGRVETWENSKNVGFSFEGKNF